VRAGLALVPAAVPAGCDHETGAHWVAVREATGGAPQARAQQHRALVGPFQEKIDELIDRSRGRIRADQAHSKLVAMGYQASERTTRRGESGASAGLSDSTQQGASASETDASAVALRAA